MLKNINIHYWSKITGAIVFLLLVTIALFYYGFLRFNYPSENQYPLRGIDVSHHQGVIDWSKVKRDNISFAYIKATEGADYQDPQFIINWNQAGKAGVYRGAYHFFNFCSSAVKQAKQFISVVPNIKNSLPPVIDIEFMGYCKVKPTLEVYRKSVKVFILLLRQHYKKTPIIYTTYESYAGYLDNSFLNHPLWIRDIYWAPRLYRNRSWVIWQYSNRGRVKGIKSYVDLNVFNGSREKLQSLLNPE